MEEEKKQEVVTHIIKVDGIQMEEVYLHIYILEHGIDLIIVIGIVQ